MDVEKYAALVKGEFRKEFEKLSSLLVENNKKFNLTSIVGEEDIFYKHFVDSLAGERYFEKGAYVAEVGSGGGFPSLPLKIARKDLKFFLIESTGKKCAYLKQAAESLKLDGVEVFCGRAEDAGKNDGYREKFDVATARAVARLNTLCEYCMPLVRTGGRFIAYKGDCDGEITEAEKAVSVLGGEIEKIEKYGLPNGDKRSLVIIKKIAPTPLKYPRGQGKERKSPIA